MAGKLVKKRITPYGSWLSSINAECLVSGSSVFNERYTELQSNGRNVYWVERLADADGRRVIMCRNSEAVISQLTPADFDVGSKILGYGASSLVVDIDAVYFSNRQDGRLYRQQDGVMPEAISIDQAVYYADCILDQQRNRLICVCEDHRETQQNGGYPTHSIVAINLDDSGDNPQKPLLLFRQSDFVAYPRLSRDGKRLAFITWEHPDMPWDATKLWLADVTSGGELANCQCLNTATRESVLDPQWTASGALYAVSDRSDWWSIYQWDVGKTQFVYGGKAEIGGPLWMLGQQYFAVLDDNRAIVRSYRQAEGRFDLVDLVDSTAQPIDRTIAEVTCFCLHNNSVVFSAQYKRQFDHIMQFDLDTMSLHLIAKTGGAALGSSGISSGRAIEYPTTAGDTAHAFFYPPQSDIYRAPAGEQPPLIVAMHGGPTLHRTLALSMESQFWTNHGFAVLVVNYRGSTGFGRPYRERLYGQWGRFDVQDAVNGARYLVDNGTVDKHRVVIRGGSAGGWSVLAAMAYSDEFAAGTAYYPVSDLELMRLETHKFESHYLDKLIAPYLENKTAYVERSPINHLDCFQKPMLILQGLDDPVVPPAQSERIVRALAEKGVPVRYLAFAGEAHGFRKAANIVRAYMAELRFYRDELGITLPNAE